MIFNLKRALQAARRDLHQSYDATKQHQPAVHIDPAIRRNVTESREDDRQFVRVTQKRFVPVSVRS